MFYGMIAKDGIEYAAFETEAEAATWIVDELGSDYASAFWVEGGKLRTGGKMYDFTVAVFASLEEAVVSAARCDGMAAAMHLRALCDAVEASEEEEA